MLVGYARVSTDLQTTDGQIDALNAVGCERVFEESMSGTRADRPQLAAALEFAREGDVLVVARLNRLARSMRQLLTTVDALKARSIGLRSLHENIDTTSATGRLILHIFAALGQFEVELLRERTRTALAASRARGRIGGRPPALNAIQIRAARAMLASGTMSASMSPGRSGAVPRRRIAMCRVDAPPLPRAGCQPPPDGRIERRRDFQCGDARNTRSDAHSLLIRNSLNPS